MKIPIFSFPWSCYKCKNEMTVTYPFTEEVYDSKFRGNLAKTHCYTLQSDVIGNICPSCGAYQGNYFVWDECLIENAYDLKQFITGFMEVEVNCVICGKELIKENIDDDILY